MVCGFCPIKRPVKQEDINLEVKCNPSEAVLKYNLDLVSTWGFENMEVEISYRKKNSEDMLGREIVEDFGEGHKEVKWESLCSGMEYVFCVEVTHDNMSSLDKPVCQVIL